MRTLPASMAMEHLDGTTESRRQIQNKNPEQLDRIFGNPTDKMNDQPAWVAILDLCRDYILVKDEIG